MASVRATAAAAVVAAVIAGCSGMPANNRSAARVKMASFRGDGLSFRYPAAWTARRWPLLGTRPGLGIISSFEAPELRFVSITSSPVDMGIFACRPEAQWRE
jgi:hypothetical protein